MNVKTISRSAGRSATAAAAYRAGVEIADERTGEVHDYTRKRGVEVSELVLPAGAPDWARDRAALWNAAEQAENRKNSTVAREIVVALPAELNPQQRADLARTLAAELVERHGCAVDLAIHAPGAKGDDRNHHAHLLMTTRRLEPEGFTAKTRELDAAKNKEVPHWRERWASLANEALERAGRSERIDHRSLKDQGIGREPTTHRGPTATAIERRTGEPSRRRQDCETHETGREFAKGAAVVNLAEYREAIARQKEEAAAVIEKAPEPTAQEEALQATRAEHARKTEELRIAAEERAQARAAERQAKAAEAAPAPSAEQVYSKLYAQTYAELQRASDERAKALQDELDRWEAAKDAHRAAEPSAWAPWRRADWERAGGELAAQQREGWKLEREYKAQLFPPVEMFPGHTNQIVRMEMARVAPGVVQAADKERDEREAREAKAARDAMTPEEKQREAEQMRMEYQKDVRDAMTPDQKREALRQQYQDKIERDRQNERGRGRGR